MQFEVERKFWIEDFEVVQQRLDELDVQVDEGKDQVDQYFTHPARDFTKTDEVFRLRNVGEQNYITYKGARIDATTKTRQELELPLADGESVPKDFAKLLTVLGFEPIMTVRKHRRKAAFEWEGTRIEVCLDEINQLGSFVELEATSDARGLDSAKEKIGTLAERLELTRPERRSYLELLLHQLAPSKLGKGDLR